MPNYPTPGAVGVLGQIVRVDLIPATGKWSGIVESFASLYGTPPSADQGGFTDPLRFSFQSDTVFFCGDHVQFDLVAGKFASYATNVVKV